MSALSPTTRRWMSPPPGYDNSHSYAARDGSTSLKPYLTLPYILSLTWLAYPIISLLFVAFRLSISSASAEDSVADAKEKLLASCAAAEKAATVAASLPRYMAIGTNKQITDAVNGTMNAARATLVLSLTILEGVINFAIDIYRSTFFCFLELVVRGGLGVLIGAVQEFNTFLTNTFSGIKSTIQDSINSVNSAIQTAINGINDVNPFSDISAPQFSVPDLSSLDNVTLPTTFEDALTNLNNSLPTLDQVRDTIQDFVDTPFEDLKADINNTFAGLNYNSSALFVPQQQTISFCGDMDTSVVDDLGRDIVKITKIGIILIVVLALLLIGAHCALEWYKWRCLQQHLQYTREAWVTDPTMNNHAQGGGVPSLRMTDHNLLVLAGSQQHPLLTRISNQLASLLKLTPSQHTNLQWFFHYVFHPPALAVFLIGFLGLLSVQIQLIAIHPLEEKYSAQVAASVNDFSNTIATNINNNMFNQSATYANEINSQINATQSTINDGLFGWVNGTTTTLNSTLVTFYSDIQNAVSTVFNGTVLEDPMQEFIRCIIGTKIEAIENALTFLNENLHVDMPTMNETALMISQGNVDEVSTPIAQAAVGDGSEDNGGLVAKIVNSYVASLKKERLMFAVFIGLWGLVVLIAILIILWHSFVKPKLEERKRRRFQRDRDISAPLPFNFANEKVNRKSAAPQAEGFFNVNLKTPVAAKDTNENRTHEPQRSWDSLLDSQNNDRDQSSTAESQLKSKISRPRKLLATGNKAGRERFVSDEERAQVRQAEFEAASSTSEEPKHYGGWMRRLTKVFTRQPSTETNNISEGSSFETPGSMASRGRTRQRPNLTISTSNSTFANVSRDRLPTAGLDAPPMPSTYQTQQQGQPASAWSISPAPPKSLPWVQNPLATAGKALRGPSKGKRGPGLPVSPRSPPVPYGYNASNSINANIGAFPIAPQAPKRAATVTPASQMQTPGPGPMTGNSVVPSYYHSNFSNSNARDSLLPPFNMPIRNQQPGERAHKRTSSLPIGVNPFSPGLPPPGMGMRDSIQRKPIGGVSGALDPFRTPFDDDARVVPENWPKPPAAIGSPTAY